MQLDTDFVRSQYSVFRDPERAGWAFFENAGGSYVPDSVVQRLDTFFRYTKVQPYGPFPAAAEAGEAMDAGYQCIADLLSTTEDRITIGPSTSLNTYVLAQALAPGLRPGDEIVVTNQDHEANIGCWERLAACGAVIKHWTIDPSSGELDPARLADLVSPRTRAVCFTLCSNIVGTFQDVETVCRIVHDAGALAIADGVSYAPHRIVAVDQLGVDVYLFSTYKTFGTHLGVMWIADHVYQHLTCQGHYFNVDRPRYRMSPTGPLHAEIAALAGIGEYFDALYAHHFREPCSSRHERARRVLQLVEAHELDLADRLLAVLARHATRLRIVGQPTAQPGRRAPTISFVPRDVLPSRVATALAARRIAARNGHFYALRCLQALGIENPDEGVVRTSLVHYNTLDEVERLDAALAEILQ